MLLTFRHCVSHHLLALLSMEGWIVFVSLFAGLQLDRVGLAPVQPGPGRAIPKALALSLLVLTMFYVCRLHSNANLTSSLGSYGSSGFVRLACHSLTIARTQVLTGFMTSEGMCRLS